MKSNQKLVGFISASPGTLRIREKSHKMAFFNFMCVHKKLRDKRLAPLLIKESTRRCSLYGYFLGFATSGTFGPTPISSVRYFHRSLNPKKLLDIGFSRLGPKETLSRITKMLKVCDVYIYTLIIGTKASRLENHGRK